MKDGKAEKAIQSRIDAPVEAPVHGDQRDIEAAVLATLAWVINSDVSDLKYSLLQLDAADFYFQDHRDIFAAMKALADAGDHVDQLTVKAKGAGWPDLSKVKAEAAETYKRQVIARANVRQAAIIGREYLEKVEGAAPDDIPGLIADLQKTVFDIERTKRFAPPARSEADLIDDFRADLEFPSPGYRTGFDRLDFLTNGLKAGVFVIAAAPAAGETTFIKQLADQGAEFKDGVPGRFLAYEH